MKPFLVLATVVFSTSLAGAAPLRSGQVPLRARSLQGFVPRGWEIEHLVRGDLNLDKRPDVALVLVEDKPAKDAQDDATQRERALIVALDGRSGWHRVGLSSLLLLGTRDGGAFYGAVETPVRVSIQHEVLIVQMEAGSREVEETTHRFRFEPKRNGVFLIGFDSTTRDRATGNSTTWSSDFLTGWKTGSYERGGVTTSSTAMSRVSRHLKSLESLREDDRYAR